MTVGHHALPQPSCFATPGSLLDFRLWHFGCACCAHFASSCLSDLCVALFAPSLSAQMGMLLWLSLRRCCALGMWSCAVQLSKLCLGVSSAHTQWCAGVGPRERFTVLLMRLPAAAPEAPCSLHICQAQQPLAAAGMSPCSVLVIVTLNACSDCMHHLAEQVVPRSEKGCGFGDFVLLLLGLSDPSLHYHH